MQTKFSNPNVKYGKYSTTHSRTEPQLSLYKTPKIRYLILLVLITFTVVVYLPNYAFAQARFQATSVNAGAATFLQRFDEQIFNVDFIVSSTINAAGVAERESRELDEDEINSTVIESNAAGSVIVPIGADVDELIIINDNDGDNIAISR